MRRARKDFFPSELYWLDRIGPVSRLTQRHGGVPTTVADLVTMDRTGARLCVAFDRLIEPDWDTALAAMVRKHERVLVDARVTLQWPTASGIAYWRRAAGAPFMILNLYDVLMRAAHAGAGLIRLYGYQPPHPRSRKFIPMPWSDVWVVALLIERGETPSLDCEGLLRVRWPS